MIDSFVNDILQSEEKRIIALRNNAGRYWYQGQAATYEEAGIPVDLPEWDTLTQEQKNVFIDACAYVSRLV